jgi:hypothetical protein
LHDHPHVVAELADQQRRLQRVQVVLVHADDGCRAVEPGTGEGFRGARARADMRHAPAGQDARQPDVRVVVHDHRRHPGQAEFLDDAKTEAAQPADDHVPAPVRI